MDTTSIYTVIITIITVLGSTSAWRFYEKRIAAKRKTEEFIKDDCKTRITRLETLLENASKQKEEMREEILQLTAEVSELRVKVSYLEKDKNDLLNKITVKPVHNTKKRKS